MKNKSLKNEANEMIKDFEEHCKSRNYIECAPKLITSGIDKSVSLLGSHSSVLKPYFLNEKIPKEGLYIVQNCVRTQNLRIMDTNQSLKWGSYFTSLGALANVKSYEKFSHDMFDFFKGPLNLSNKDIKIRVNSKDKDLLKICLDYYPKECLEIDTQEESYYKHKYGVSGIFGRNFNIALKDKSKNTFSDVGNIISIESKEKKLGIEIGLGVSTIFKQLYSLDHVLDIYGISGLEKVKNKKRRKLEDTIITSVALAKEGLKPSGSRMGGSIRKYLKFMKKFTVEENISYEDLFNIIYNLEIKEFGKNSPLVSKELIKRIEENKI